VSPSTCLVNLCTEDNRLLSNRATRVFSPKSPNRQVIYNAITNRRPVRRRAMRATFCNVVYTSCQYVDLPTLHRRLVVVVVVTCADRGLPGKFAALSRCRHGDKTLRKAKEISGVGQNSMKILCPSGSVLPEFNAVNAETPPLWAGFLLLQGSLTITYFHTGIRTIIGVESFHGPVRDGKGWDRLAMVIRHDLLSYCSWSNTTNREEVVSGDAHQR
jgi:hypothetical protein